VVRTDENLDSSFRTGDQWQAQVQERFSVSSRNENGDLVAQSLSGHESNKLFMNRQSEDFHDVSALSGIDSEADGRVFVLLDYDKDGWQDLILVNSNAPTIEIFRNRLVQKSPLNNCIAFRFVGGNETGVASDLSNRDALGAMVTVTAGGQQYLRELRCGEGFGAQNSKTILIGIGENKQIDSAEVVWPSGKKQILKELKTGTVNTVFEKGGVESEPFPKNKG